MASNKCGSDVRHLIITGVKISPSVLLGEGSYGRVFEATYNSATYAVKQLQSRPLRSSLCEPEDRGRSFLHECLLHSKLDHPNIVKMLRVCYPSEENARFPARFPALVMEIKEYNLTTLLEKSEDISMYVKLSILQDVSRGIHYLHTLSCPIVHRNLHSSNILLNNKLVAKISNLKIAKEINNLTPVEVIGHSFFIPQDGYHAFQGLSADVFSFACVVCHVLSSQNLHVSFSVKETRPLILGKQNRGSYSFPNKKLHSEVERRQCYIDQISDRSLKQLVISCLDDKSERRPLISQVCERISSIIADHYSNDDCIKMAYSLAMKEGVAESRDLQVLLVGAENAGKSCLISSFFEEKFVEKQAATKVIEVDVCKIYCKDWTRISRSDKTNLLDQQFVDQLGEKALDMVDTNAMALLSSFRKPEAVKSVQIPHQNQVFNQLKGRVVKSVKTHDTTSSKRIVKFDGTSVPSNEFVSSKQNFAQNLQNDTLQNDPESINVVLWDFPGQVIFHNTNSVFISASGVLTITFNASMKLTGEIVPREGSPAPPECATIISSIHYWLQVVDSMCSVEGTNDDLSPLQPPVILAGTHIDLLHSDIKIARTIAKRSILPTLVEELSDKHYARHLVGMNEGIEAALEQSCFFISNKCRDGEMKCLKDITIKAAKSLTKKQPIYFLKIERALLQCKEPIISKSTMSQLVAKSTFPIAENSSEFDKVLKYFHDKRVILYFSQIESLKNLVILSPQWLARLFSYAITAHSYKRGKGFDKEWKRLTTYAIVHENLLQHMLYKFQEDYPSVVKISKEQVVDILLQFHLVARITREAWFTEEGLQLPPDSGDTFIVPSLLPRDDERSPPNTKQERIVYFKFFNGFIPASLLNQLIADCICRNVWRNNRLLWMRHGKVGLQLGAKQKYYINRCEEKKSIQLTISMPVDDDVKSGEDRRELIKDITKLLDDIMKMFMPAAKRPVLLVPCPDCPMLHITLDEVCRGTTIFCSIEDGDVDLPPDYYGDLLPHRSHSPTTLQGVAKKLEVFTKYYDKFTNVLPIRNISSHFVSAGIMSFEDEEAIQQSTSSSTFSQFLRNIARSLEAGQTKSFDKLLFIMEKHGGISCKELVDQIRNELTNFKKNQDDLQSSGVQVTSIASNTKGHSDESRLAKQSSHDEDTPAGIDLSTSDTTITTSTKIDGHVQDKNNQCCNIL